MAITPRSKMRAETATGNKEVPVPSSITTALGRGLDQLVSDDILVIEDVLKRKKGTNPRERKQDFDDIEFGVTSLKTLIKNLQEKSVSVRIRNNRKEGNLAQCVFVFSDKTGTPEEAEGSYPFSVPPRLIVPLTAALRHEIGNGFADTSGFAETVELLGKSEHVKEAANEIYTISQRILKNILPITTAESITFDKEPDGNIRIDTKQPLLYSDSSPIPSRP